MLERLRKLLGGGRGEVLGGGDGDDTKFASGASPGGVGAVSDQHRHEDHEAHSPAHGDDEFEPRVPPDNS
jgi:hypothetical protein